MGIVAYEFFTPLLFNFTFRSTGGGGGGAWHPCAILSYANASGAARIFQRGPKPGSKVTERGEGVESREIFRHFVYQNFYFFVH